MANDKKKLTRIAKKKKKKYSLKTLDVSLKKVWYVVSNKYRRRIITLIMVSHGLYLQIIMISFICSKCIQSNLKAFHILHTYRVGAQRKGD